MIYNGFITALEEYDCGCISIASWSDESVLMVAAEERGAPRWTRCSGTVKMRWWRTKSTQPPQLYVQLKEQRIAKCRHHGKSLKTTKTVTPPPSVFLRISFSSSWPVFPARRAHVEWRCPTLLKSVFLTVTKTKRNKGGKDSPVKTKPTWNSSVTP